MTIARGCASQKQLGIYIRAPLKAERRQPMPIDFATEPARYRHWRLEFDGPVASLVLDVDPAGGLFLGPELKLNSYDLGVDIELADAVTLRVPRGAVRRDPLRQAGRVLRRRQYRRLGPGLAPAQGQFLQVHQRD